MKNVKVNDTHNFALIGHTGDGKTSSARRCSTPPARRRRSVASTTAASPLNYLPEEGAATHDHELGVRVRFRRPALTLVDTPGDSNFQADGQIALHALDGAVLVCLAVGGVKVGTPRMWRACERLGIPALAFVNGLDREHADFEAAVASLGELGLKTVALTLPIGAESGFRGVTDLPHEGAAAGLAGRSRPSSPARRAMRASSWSRPSPNATTRCSRNTPEEGALADDQILRAGRWARASRSCCWVLFGRATARCRRVAVGGERAAALGRRPRRLSSPPKPATARSSRHRRRRSRRSSSRP